MKILVSLIASFLLVTQITASEAQSLTFCKSVGKEGQPVGASREFVLVNGGVSLSILFQFGSARPASISYDIYKVEKGKEVFSSTINQQAAPAVNWLSKTLTLYEAGSYRVYVYNASDQLLAQGTFTVTP